MPNPIHIFVAFALEWPAKVEFLPIRELVARGRTTRRRTGVLRPVLFTNLICAYLPAGISLLN
jgi:hypothetical protein